MACTGKQWHEVRLTADSSSLTGQIVPTSMTTGLTYEKVLEDQGYEIFYADITTPDVAVAGIHVVRALVPGLVPNFPAAFPFLGQGRVQQAAVTLGWRTAPFTEAELNYFPMPHA